MSKQNPDHYTFGDVQVIDITKHLDFPCGNVVKYTARAGRKGGESRLDDLLKAQVYLETAIAMAIDERARDQATTNDDKVAAPPRVCSGCVTHEHCKKYGCQVYDNVIIDEDNSELTRAGVRRVIV